MPCWRALFFSLSISPSATVAIVVLAPTEDPGINKEKKKDSSSSYLFLVRKGEEEEKIFSIHLRVS